MIGKGNPREYERALTELSLRDPVRRASAAATVGVFGSDKDLPRLKPLVNDEAEAVRVSALYALALLGDKGAIDKLFPFVSHSREQYRKLALTALEGATRLNHGGPHGDEEACKKAQEAWKAWWEQNKGAVSWDKKKKQWVPKG